MNAILTNAYYTTNPLTIHLVGRNEDKTRLFKSIPSKKITSDIGIS